jgi:hypothetical protein
MPEQAEGEGRMQWMCVGPQSLLQNGNKTLTARGTKNEDCVKKSSFAYRLLFLQPCFRYVKLHAVLQNKLPLVLTGYAEHGCMCSTAAIVAATLTGRPRLDHSWLHVTRGRNHEQEFQRKSYNVH